MVREFVISGHSGATENTFEVPYNLTLIFDANINETCYAPNDKLSLDMIISTMKQSNLNVYKQGVTVNDYEVEFNGLFEGVSEISDNDYHDQLNEGVSGNDYSFFINHSTNSAPIKLSELCNLIQRRTSRKETIIYCIFCRGSERDVKPIDYGDFTKINPYDLDFNLDTKGGKKLKKRKYNKTKKTKKAKKTRYTRKRR